ncbi:MAG: glutamine amidotransferase [Candidatus Bathyarchaeia archaeon]
MNNMRAFVVKASDDGFFRVEEAVRSIGGKDARVRVSLFKGINFPLTYPIPSRIDRTVQGYVGLGEYNIVSLLDVDPGVFSPKESLNLVAYVENGGGLLVTGGRHALGNAIGSYEALKTIFPVFLEKKEDEVKVDAFVEISKEHPIAYGIPQDRIGRVMVVQPVIPKPDAVVVLKASGYPLLTVWDHGKGRVAVLSTYPLFPRKGRMLMEKELFFATDFYDDLLRQLLMWLSRREDNLLIKEFTCSPSRIFLGDRIVADAVLSSEKPSKLRVRFSVEKEGKLLAKEERSIAIEGTAKQHFSYATEALPNLSGFLEAKLEVLEDDGKTLNHRDWTIEATNRTRLSLDIVSRKAVVAPGSSLQLSLQAVSDEEVLPEELEARVKIIDFRGKIVHEFPSTKIFLKDGTYERASLSYDVPNLAKGRYELIYELISHERLVDNGRKPFLIVDPLDYEDFYPIIGEAWAFFDKGMIEEWIEDTIAHGFNTVAFGGDAIGDYDWEKEYDWDRLQNFAEAYAQERGLAVAINYSLLIDCHRDRPPAVCLNNPGFEKAEKDLLLRQLNVAAKIPRLYAVETVDEPLVSPNSVCYCQYCKEEFRRKYGLEMPIMSRIRDYDVETRLKLYEWLSYYWAKGFRTMYELKRQAGFKFNLAHTFCQLSFGSFCPEYYYRDSFSWAPYCDILDFDVYPYMYPMWRGSERLRFHALHYHLSGHRVLTRFYGKPLGFFVETTERNYPMYIPPVKASSEVAYTAIAHGANYLKTFINVPFTGPPSNNGPSKARWDQFGEELRKINMISPLFTKTEKARARFAMLFAFSDWLLNHYHMPGIERGWPKHMEDRPLNRVFPFEYTPWNVYEACFRAFGELEVLHEKLVDEGELRNYKALVLPRMKFIPDSVAEAIKRIVLEGGILIFDSIPPFNEKGEERASLTELVGGEVVELKEGLEIRKGIYGKGRTLFFNFDFDDVYSSAVERGDEDLMRHLERTIRDFLFREGMRPNVYSTNPEVEAGLWEGRNTLILVLVNHSNKRERPSLTIYKPAFLPNYAYDIANLEEISFRVEDGDIKLELNLEEREGRIIAFYPERVFGNRIELETMQVKRGEDLCYRVIVEGQDHSPAKGHHVIEVTVSDPEGRFLARYGGLHSTTDGVYEKRIPLAINELEGIWTITAYERYTRRRSRAQFRVV